MTNVSTAATIFAYGQTSSGKTYTMRGITEKAVNDIYQHIVNVSFTSFLCLLLLYLIGHAKSLDIFTFCLCVEAANCPLCYVMLTDVLPA